MNLSKLTFFPIFVADLVINNKITEKKSKIPKTLKPLKNNKIIIIKIITQISLNISMAGLKKSINIILVSFMTDLMILDIFFCNKNSDLEFIFKDKWSIVTS